MFYAAWPYHHHKEIMNSTIHIHLQFLFADEFIFLHTSRTNTAIFLNLENTSDYEYLRHIQTMSRLAVRDLRNVF